jgi:ADP-ribose pyrophosphatase YjhB (NUDIX family)
MVNDAEHTWLAWAKRLQALASTGAHFSSDPYDLERYREIGRIANDMLADIATVPPSRIEGLVSDFATGYATPKVDVRGAVICDDKVLLVREASDRLWTLPGGYADVGISPAENVVKEIWEKASIQVTARSLYAIRHKARHGYDADVRDFYKLFFLCEPIGDMRIQPGPETIDVGFFAADALPPLSTGRVIARDITAAFEHRAGASPAVAFD